jgi:tetratricopeptide (TPR) repeat protein
LGSVAVLAIVALSVAFAAVMSPRGVWLRVAVVPQDLAIADATPERVTERIFESALALRDQARASALVPAIDAEPLPIFADTSSGALALAHRTMRSLMPRNAARITPEIVEIGDDLELVLREWPGGATLRSRVKRGPGAIDALVARAAEDLLLLSTPLDAAALVAQNPEAVLDVDRLDEVVAMLTRGSDATSDPRALYVHALQFASQRRCRDALGMLDRVISIQPDAPLPYALAAECFARIGERERALARLGEAERHANGSAFARSFTGQTYVRVGQPAHGLTLLLEAHGAQPALSGNDVAIGEALIAMHRPAEAIVWLDAHPPAAALRTRWLAALGLAQVKRGLGPAAESTAQALREAAPANGQATRIEAELALAMKSWPQALGRFGALKLMHPDDGPARAGEGFALLGLNRPDDAVAAFVGCADVAPGCAACRLGLGIALREADRAEQALSAFAEAAKLDALDPRIPFETARTLRALLRRDEAAAYSERAETLALQLGRRLQLP